MAAKTNYLVVRDITYETGYSKVKRFIPAGTVVGRDFLEAPATKDVLARTDYAEVNAQEFPIGPAPKKPLVYIDTPVPLPAQKNGLVLDEKAFLGGAGADAGGEGEGDGLGGAAHDGGDDDGLGVAGDEVGEGGGNLPPTAKGKGKSVV